MTAAEDRKNQKELRRLRASMKLAPIREVTGLNDAGNAPCPDCVALLAQVGVPCSRHTEELATEQYEIA